MTIVGVMTLRCQWSCCLLTAGCVVCLSCRCPCSGACRRRHRHANWQSDAVCHRTH